MSEGVYRQEAGRNPFNESRPAPNSSTELLSGIREAINLVRESQPGFRLSVLPHRPTSDRENSDNNAVLNER